jgi:hypothetical protein
MSSTEAEQLEAISSEMASLIVAACSKLHTEAHTPHGVTLRTQGELTRATLRKDACNAPHPTPAQKLLRAAELLYYQTCQEIQEAEKLVGETPEAVEMLDVRWARLYQLMREADKARAVGADAVALENRVNDLGTS